jgi:hypothetical protein
MPKSKHVCRRERLVYMRTMLQGHFGARVPYADLQAMMLRDIGVAVSYGFPTQPPCIRVGVVCLCVCVCVCHGVSRVRVYRCHRDCHVLCPQGTAVCEGFVFVGLEEEGCCLG